MSTSTVSPEQLLQKQMLPILAAAVLFWTPLVTEGQPQIRVFDLEQKINARVNSERLTRNVKALAFDEALSHIARGHSLAYRCIITYGPILISTLKGML